MSSNRLVCLIGTAGLAFATPAGDPPIVPRPKPVESRSTVRDRTPGQPRAPGEVKVRGKILGLENNDHALIRAEGPRQVRGTTRVGGVWELGGLVPGTYRITPHHGRYVFCPASRRLLVGQKDVNELRFTASPVEPGEPLDSSGRVGTDSPRTPLTAASTACSSPARSNAANKLPDG